MLYFQFQHPNHGELQRDQFIWSLSSIPLLEGYLHVLDGEPLKGVVEALIQQYQTSVIPKRRRFRSCESPSCLLLPHVVSSLPWYQPLVDTNHLLVLRLKCPHPRFCTCRFLFHPDFVAALDCI